MINPDWPMMLPMKLMSLVSFFSGRFMAFGRESRDLSWCLVFGSSFFTVLVHEEEEDDIVLLVAGIGRALSTYEHPVIGFEGE